MRRSAASASRIAIIWIAIILLMAAFSPLIQADGDAPQAISGQTYTLSGPKPPEGQSYIYQWSVTDGSPQTSGESSFKWTAPPVLKPTEVEASLEVANSLKGCSNRSLARILVVPKKGARISVEKDCMFSPPVMVGDSVVYTYNVTNSGDVALRDVSLSDVHNWGPNCQPALIRGDDNGDGTLDPGESWWYECRYSVPDPSDFPRLYVMGESGGSSRTVAIISRLTDMKVRLEIMMDRLRQNQKAFDYKAATLIVENRTLNKTSYAFNNFTNDITGERLSKVIDSMGRLNSTIYIDAVSGAILITRYDSRNRVTFEEIRQPHGKESLSIQYDMPAQGYRTYTVIDYHTGDTLILIVDPQGSILRMEYRKTPGYRPYEERFFLKNTVTAKARDPDGLEVFDSDSFTLQIFRPLPILRVTKTAHPDSVAPGAVLNYTITYENLGGNDAHDAVVKETYNRSLEFILSDPPPDFGASDRWTVGDLDRGESGTIRVMMRAAASARPGDTITNRVDLTCKENSSAQAVINSTVAGSELRIVKIASAEIVGMGDYFTYTIDYINQGPGKERNVVIHDYLDEHVDFISFQSSAPLKNGSLGRDHWWFAGDLNPGDGGTIDILVKTKSKSHFGDSTTTIYNTYNINSSEKAGVNATLKTYVVHSLWITKTANKTAINRDEDLTYTISYGNAEKRTDDPDGPTDARDVYIVDALPDVEVVSVSPRPTSVSGNTLTWFFPVLKAEENGTIVIDVHIPKLPKVDFYENSSVKGVGYAYVHKGLSTAEDKPALTNNVRIWGHYGPIHSNASASATVTLIGAAGTRICTSEHGSGYYEEEAQSRLVIENKSISLKKGIFAKHKKTSFSLPGNRNITYESLWSDRTTAENRIANEFVSESYMYTDALSKNSSFQVDMNQTVYASDSEFNDALMQISYQKRAENNKKVAAEMSDRYHGSFKVRTSVDSYGSSIKYARSSKGKGFVSSDNRPSEFQRSFEHGSGYYSSEENIQGDSIAKKSKMLYAPLYTPLSAPLNRTAGTRNASYASLWREGMITGDRSQGLIIGEEVRYAYRIEKEGGMEKSSLSFAGDFNGTMDIIISRGELPKAERQRLDQRFAGSFKVGTAISVYTAPKFLYPHVSIRKKAKMIAEDTVLFIINVTNDGNKPLKSINVSDLLPEGLIFINSSIRPKVDGQDVRWSFPSLDISRTLTIKLNARIEDLSSTYTNAVRVEARYEEQILQDSNSTSIDPSYGYLPCCLEINESLNASGTLNISRGDGFWKDWKPGPCLNATSEMTDCFKYIEEYYSELDRTEGTEKARSSYDVP